MPTILVVEDQPDLREMIASTLRLSGYMVVATQDDEAAFLQVGTTRPDLIIMGLNPPAPSGRRGFRRFRLMSACSSTPIVLVSTDHDLANMDACLDAGARDYISLPFEPAHLVGRIHSCL